MKASPRVVVPLLAATAAALAGPPTALAATATSTGTVRVTIATPSGVPANVGLDDRTTGTPDGYVDQFAAKAPSGTNQVVSLAVPAGSYHVALPAVTFGGTRYTGGASMPEVVVRAGQTSTLNVSYTAEPGARNLQLTAINRNSVGLSWTAPAGSRFSLRRVAGDTPVTQMTQGVAVPVTGSTATDSGLQPGAAYSYSLFTQGKSDARWYGPLAVVASTASTDADRATYVAAPSTLVTEPGDVQSAVPTGSGVQVEFGRQVAPPLLGSAVVLPKSAALPGGYLGIVNKVSGDGRRADLVAGGLSDAFSYYDLTVKEFGDTQGPASADSVAAASTPPPRVPESPAQAAALPAGIASCLGASGTNEVSYDPKFDLGGHFHVKINKGGFIGAPTGASMDVALTATVSGAVEVATTAALNCSVDLQKFSVFVPIATTPVPISFYLAPNVQFGIGGAVGIKGVGATATGGVQFSGTLDLAGGASFSGMPILEAHPFTPIIKANGSIGAKVGGQIIVGPGAGTKGAGVIAGVGGELNPLDASFGPVFSAQDSRFNACLLAKAAFTRNMTLTAKAWVGPVDITKTVTLDEFKGETPYPGSPWGLPDGCEKESPVDLGGDVLGDGVTKVEDKVEGSPSQWGYIGGFVPGAKTWVLSTGLIDSASGTPDQFASTSIGGPGDAALALLAGHPTYDAAAYEAVVKPTGDTLHVKYAFASEEYPEYVGSSFNDAMAVFVNGQNCATIPDTQTPVSINTVNAQVNSSYYVDNSKGAAGYSTSMDGLTVPLTCSVPVTPGEPVTVKIAVADSSDSVFDSAVALLDQGIWSD